MASKEYGLGPVYLPGRRVAFWLLEYDSDTGATRIGFKVVGMPDAETREALGEMWYAFDESSRSFVHAHLWELATRKMAELQAGLSC